MLPALSADAFTCVAAFLPASDVGVLQQSSRSIQLAGSNPAIWKAAFERLGHTVDSSSDAQASEDWKLRFVEQWCLEKGGLCCLCYASTANDVMATFGLTLCSPCRSTL